MVARIYVNSPSLTENQNNNSSSTNQIFTLDIAIAAAFAWSTHNLCYSVIGFLAVCLLKYLIRNLRTRSRFQRAVIEITSFGVQLVSIYGHDCSSLNYPGKKIESEPELASGRSIGVQSNVSGVKENAIHVQNSSSHNSTTLCNRRVRAFIPRERIIDVIVMEIVWPHCVWSQVAFRVDKGSKAYGQSDHSDLDETSEHFSQSQNQNPASSGNMNELKENHCESKRQYKSDVMQMISSLMKRNRIAIIPVLPEKCRGQLSYKECLQLQEEIEELLEDCESK